MIKNQNKAGIIVSAAIPLFILPARISEGQLQDPVNLVGSEIVIFLMSLTCWYCLIYLQKKDNLSAAVKLILSLLCCCVLSNLFYFTFNPIFKDFPFRTVSNPLYIKILMLSSRGILMSVILVPTAYYIKKDQEARLTRRENDRLAMERVYFQNRLLELAVVERTRALQDTLSLLRSSQNELEYQFYIQSRLVASITHDIRGPFKFLVQISDRVVALAGDAANNDLHNYASELNKSLVGMFTFVNNLLEFTKLPLTQKISKSEEVNLAALINEKSALFQGIIVTNNNKLVIDVDHEINVKTNYNLLGIILHNLIDNANKHTMAGEITIGLTDNENHVHLFIRNSGSLREENIAEWINSELDMTDPKKITDTNQVRGIGLVLVKEIATILDIGISMESTESDTTVQLNFARNGNEEMSTPAT